MDFYPYYQEARNKSWQTLIDCKINKLPVDLNAVAGFYCIEIALYSKSNMIQLFKHAVKKRPIQYSSSYTEEDGLKIQSVMIYKAYW